jgi:hypothetical protein
MTPRAEHRVPRFRIRPLALGLVALAAGGCEAETVYYPVYVVPGPPPAPCHAGVQEGAVDTDGLLDLDPGYGVGVTVEVASDGTWRFAVACDSLVSGYPCNWTVLVAPIDGTIDGFEPEALEDGDFIESHPTPSDSTLADGVFLDALTSDEIDAFSVFATPGTGMSVTADIDGYCGGPYVFWLDGGEVRSSKTNTTELFPQ